MWLVVTGLLYMAHFNSAVTHFNTTFISHGPCHNRSVPPSETVKHHKILPKDLTQVKGRVFKVSMSIEHLSAFFP